MASTEVYVVHSNRPIDYLNRIMEECGGAKYLKIIYKTSYEGPRGKNKAETNKTIVFCPKSIVDQMQKKYEEFQGNISDYKWETFPLPKEKDGETWNLHVSGVPNDFTSRQACETIEKLFSCVITPTNPDGSKNYTINFPIRSRESGEIVGYGAVNFMPSVDREIIKLCKLILHNTPMSFRSHSKDRRIVNCVWHRIPGASSSQKSILGLSTSSSNAPGVNTSDSTKNKEEIGETVEKPVVQLIASDNLSDPVVKLHSRKPSYQSDLTQKPQNAWSSSRPWTQVTSRNSRNSGNSSNPKSSRLAGPVQMVDMSAISE